MLKEYDKDIVLKNENNLEILNKSKNNSIAVSNYNDLYYINNKKSSKNCIII